MLTDTGTEGALWWRKPSARGSRRCRSRTARRKWPKYVTVSIGVATRIGDPDVGPDGLIAAADAALYKAKHIGRNRCVSESEERSVNY